MSRQLRKECVDWKTWSHDKFVEELRYAVPDTKVSRPYSSETFYELVAKQNVQIDLENDIYELNLDSALIATKNKFPDVTPEEELKATKLLISQLPEQPVNWQAIIFRERRSPYYLYDRGFPICLTCSAQSLTRFGSGHA
jgi:hypothetical protein